MGYFHCNKLCTNICWCRYIAMTWLNSTHPCNLDEVAILLTLKNMAKYKKVRGTNQVRTNFHQFFRLSGHSTQLRWYKSTNGLYSGLHLPHSNIFRSYWNVHTCTHWYPFCRKWFRTCHLSLHLYADSYRSSIQHKWYIINLMSVIE